MAYDGVVVAATVSELKQKILNGSISKVAQPEKDELLFTLKVNRKPVYLRLSANASVPFVCLETENTLSPVTAPGFCMALRKHIGGGRIVKVEQAPGLERIIIFTIEHMDEMGDRGEKKLVCELMGRHSNIILLGKDDVIIDSIKHVSALTSSLREVLPGRKYFIPVTTHRGLGKVMDEEIAFRAGVDTRIPADELTGEERERLTQERERLISDAEKEVFQPNIVYENKRPAEFAAVRLRSLEGGAFTARYFDSMSEVVRTFFENKAVENRIRAKSEDIRLTLKNLIERNARKLELQEKQLADTEKKEKYRLWGELLNAFGYGQDAGQTEFRCTNYYDGDALITIPLDKDLSPLQNAKKYFDRYQKLKRTREALEKQVEETASALYQLESILGALSLCENEADLRSIRGEMAAAGFIRRNEKPERVRKEEKKTAPLHFVSSDGLDIYVGRNNEQNEELDFQMAGPDDWWFHAKKIPGSHVIVKTGSGELPDRTCMEAAALAAGYSRAGKDGGRIEVDYVRRKELKKVPGAPKGFVVYHTNYSILVEPKQVL